VRIRNTKRYICDHCSKGFWKKEYCLEHEPKCYRNPKIKSCWNCKSFLKDDKPWFCEEYEKDLCINPTKKHEMKFKNKNCDKFK